ncbi:MAG TPA: hypothetical protein VGD38_01125 [Pyrinomonadaceae bacterium]
MKKVSVLTGILVTLLLSSLTTLAQIKSREDVLKEINAKRAELADLEKAYLSPAEEDQVQFSEFLQTPNTGLVRLLPRQKFDSDVYKENQRSMTLRGGGAFYSFSRLTHEYGGGSDLALDQNQFWVGFAGSDYGFFTALGDVPLESVSAETPAAALFGAYKAAKDEAAARTEYRRLVSPVDLGGIPIRNRVPVRVNSTYLLRSIGYLRSDVLVAFRVVRMDADGSVTILWKLLKKYETPGSKRPETAVAQ